MQTLKNISIPKPCTALWNQMLPVEQGRYCNNCCKTVIDFTGMTNAEAIKFISLSDNLCGRLTPDQLTTINLELNKGEKLSFWPSLLAAVALLCAFPGIEAKAQQLDNIERILM